MFTPASILKLWKQVTPKFGLTKEAVKSKEKTAVPKVKQAQDDGNRIVKGLTNLITIGRGDFKVNATALQFAKKRDMTAKAMKKHCKLLKPDDLKPCVTNLASLRKAVKQLTVAVENLEPKHYSAEADQAEPDLKSLDKVDTSGLDEAMKDPNFGIFSDAELDAGDEDVQREGGSDTTQPQQETETESATDKAKLWEERWAVLSQTLLKVLKVKPTNAAEIQRAASEAMKASKKKEFDPGLDWLDRLEQLMNAALPSTLADRPVAQEQPVNQPRPQAQQATDPDNLARQLQEYDTNTYRPLAAFDTDGAVNAQRDNVANQVARLKLTNAVGEADKAMQVLLQMTEPLLKARELFEDVQERLQKFDTTDYPKVETLDAGQLRDQRQKVADLQTGKKCDQAAEEMTKLEKMTAQVARLTKEGIDPTKLKMKHNPLAEGSYGAVYPVDTGDPTKKLVLKTAFTHAKEELKTEAEAYALLGEHPNIVKCYGIVNVDGQEGLLMEALEGGKLDNAFAELKVQREQNALNEREYWAGLQNMFQGMMSGLAHMEGAGFVHNDVKGDNVMIDSKTGEAKLIDVGLITRIGGASKGGARALLAPEKPHLAGGKTSDKNLPATGAQDSYSAGQLLHEQEEGSLFKGVPDPTPLKPENPGKAATEPGKYATGFDSAYVDFLSKIMHKDPAQRLTPSQALEHRFLAEGLGNVDDPVEEGGTIQKVMAAVLAGNEKAQLESLRKKVEDGADDDDVQERNEEKLKALEEKVKSSREEELKELEALERKVRSSAQEMAGKDKTWKADVKAADKAQKDALKVFDPVEKALMKGTVNQTNADQMSNLVQGPLKALNDLEKKLSKHREDLTEATRNFGDLIRQRDMLAYKKSKENLSQEEKARVKPVQSKDADHKTLEKLAKWSRQATEAQATVTQTLVTLKELQKEVADVKAGKQPPTVPPTDQKVLKKAAEAMAKAFPGWDSVIQEAQREHDQTTRLLQGAQARKPDNPVTDQELAALKARKREFAEKAQKHQTTREDADKRLEAFEKLVGTRTKQGKGQRVAAAALDQEAQNTLLRAKGYASQLRGTGRAYQEDLRALEDTLDAIEQVAV
jgi:serine/threonine protein kinase